MWPGVQSVVVGVPHSAEPSLQAWDVEGAQNFTVCPCVLGSEMDAVSQLPTVVPGKLVSQSLHGPPQDVVAIDCPLNGLVIDGHWTTFAEHWFIESLQSPDEP